MPTYLHPLPAPLLDFLRDEAQGRGLSFEWIVVCFIDDLATS